jgi:protein-arginine kinase activator protein McsA
MTQTLHTPGPWQDNDAGLIYGQVTGDDDEAPFVCDCCAEPGSGEYTEREKANARLIAAAPQLLDALQELVQRDRAEAAESGFTDDEMTWLEDARRAIAKAKS